MQQIIQDRLSAQAANSLLNEIPEKIKAALLSYAIEMDYPIEGVIEMGLSSFLDEDAISFKDCQPMSASRK